MNYIKAFTPHFQTSQVNAASKKAPYNVKSVVYSQLQFTRVEVLSNFSEIGMCGFFFNLYTH